MNLKSYLLIVILLTAVSAQVDLRNKTRYYPVDLRNVFILKDVIRPATHTYTTYNDTSVCRQDVCNNPSAVTAYQITYTPNLGSVFACFCDNPVFDIAYMADNIGRVPYPVRRFVISYTAASVGNGGGGAYAAGRYIVFLDYADNAEVFIHESGHVFDYGSAWSLTDYYYNAVRDDACVVSNYAATNTVENFAELTIYWVYLAITNQEQEVPACLSQSIKYMSQILPKSSIQSTISTYPCTIAVRQTINRSWQSSGITYTQYDATFINNGATDVQASNLAVQLFGGQISQIYNLEQQKSGSAYVLPSYQPSIAAGKQYSWGYVVQGSSPLNVSFLLPYICKSSPTSAPTSAPVTSAPVTSAPITSAPVTSAPITSAPVTSAPITSAPVTSAPVTSAPVTSVPVTSAPVTSAPVTSAPVTSAPVTSAPVTPAPTPSSTTAPGSCTFEIRQRLSNSWTSNGLVYSQYNVVYRNAGSKAAAPVTQIGGAVTQLWNLEQRGNDGKYYLPSYQATISPNAEYSWGYIAQTSNALTVRLTC